MAKLGPDRSRLPRHGQPPRPRRLAALAIAAGIWTALAGTSLAAPSIVIEASSGAVLYEEQATQPWYPASLTKLVTVYVALKAVRERRIAFETPLAVSARAASMPPSKMGFRPGSLVTLGNALKMLMVKSANDIAVTIAEGVSGSVEAFADEMNEAAASLGLSQSHFVNPNGLPDPRHVSSARDFAILARALYVTFPEQADLFSIGALRLGGAIITNHNNLLGRYPGVDGMKTGFTCAAGFNVVASANQGGRKLIAVVLGAPNVALRTIKAAALFDRGFAGIDRPGGPVAALPGQGSAPPDMRNSICHKRGKAIAEFNAENERLIAPLEAANGRAFAGREGSSVIDANALARPAPMARRIALVPAPSYDPVPVSIGAPDGYAGAIAQARPAHSPVGTEPPPGTASAYAAVKEPTLAEGGSPLQPDAGAIPLKLRGKHARQAARKHRHAPATTPTKSALAARDSKVLAAPVKQSRAAKGQGVETKTVMVKPATDAHSSSKPGASAKKGAAAKPVAAVHPAAPAKPAAKPAKKPNREAKAAPPAPKAKTGAAHAGE